MRGSLVVGCEPEPHEIGTRAGGQGRGLAAEEAGGVRCDRVEGLGERETGGGHQVIQTCVQILI